MKERFDYGQNPDKTEGGELISSYGCDHMTADAEFLLSKAKYKAATGREQRRDADVLCYQIRQSFKPGEITPEEANRIGYETAMRWTKGKYAFFVATHTDKAHIHNHIYYNSTSLDCTRKFRDFIGSGRAVRRLSDRICLENNLSVITNPKLHSKGRFLHYGAWLGTERQPPYKEQLRLAINEALAKRPADFDAFLRLMEASGYTVKHGRGGAISFLVPGQERATRLRASTLGDGYDPEDIKAVIAGERPIPEQPVLVPAAPRRVNLIVDIQERLRSGSNQKKILQKAAKDKGYTDTIFFVDDGITGTTMKRPGFQKMIAAIEAGYISAVFVKDLSRLGRNYIEVGKLTEEFFPLHDVRLVAVSDGVDSDEGEDDFTPFKNIMNEYYAKDISKKRRIVNKMKGNAGIPLSPPPYGYIKNPDDPRFWVVDPVAADVVRRIYRMALEGYGLAETAAALGADGIVNPTYYWRSKGTSRGGSKSTLEPTKWGHTTIKKILTTQEYCGDVINFKSYSKSYKMKRRIENSEENRAIFLNVHEAIIDRPTWEKVQALKAGTRRKRPTVTQEPSAFSGVMKCPECGGNLNFHFNQNNHDIKFFSCQNHNSGLRKCSSTHYIRLDFLEQVVLYEVHRLACFANEYENDFIKAMVGRSAKVAENERVRKKRELDGLLARDRELDTLFERLYEDNVSGKIDDARFAKMAKRYEQEQGENAGRIKALRLEVKKLEEKRMDVDDFLETVRHYTDATKITKRMVAELIDHIEVYPAVKEDGVTNQRVTIHYNCIGAFEVPDRRKIPERDILLETRKGVALSYAPAV